MVAPAPGFGLLRLKPHSAHFQVRVSQLAVDGSREYRPLMHHSQVLCSPGLALFGRDMDATDHQLRSRETHQQRDGRQRPCKCVQSFVPRRGGGCQGVSRRVTLEKPRRCLPDVLVVVFRNCPSSRPVAKVALVTFTWHLRVLGVVDGE